MLRNILGERMMELEMVWVLTTHENTRRGSVLRRQVKKTRVAEKLYASDVFRAPD